MTATEWMRKNATGIERGVAIRECRKATNCGIENARKSWRIVFGNVEQAVKKEKVGRDLADFAEQYNKDTIIPKKIEAALKELGSCWEYESEFVKRAGVSFADWGHYREAYSENFLMIKSEGKRVWSGSKAMIVKMKGML